MCKSIRVSAGSEKSWLGLDVSNSILCSSSPEESFAESFCKIQYIFLNYYLQVDECPVNYPW